MTVPIFADGTAGRLVRRYLLRGSTSWPSSGRCALLDLDSSTASALTLLMKLGLTLPRNFAGLGSELLLLEGIPGGGSIFGGPGALLSADLGRCLTSVRGTNLFGALGGASLSSLDLSETADFTLDALEWAADAAF